MLVGIDPTSDFFDRVDARVRRLAPRDPSNGEVIDRSVSRYTGPVAARTLEVAPKVQHRVLHGWILGILALPVKAHMPRRNVQNCLMKAKAWRPPVQKILAENIQALMDANKMELGSQPKLAKAAKLDQTTVGRVLAAKHKVQIDTLEALAAAFGVEPYQLLVPGLNPKNPQVLRVLSPAEENLYKALEEARKPGTQ